MIKERHEFLDNCHERKRPKLLQTLPSVAARADFPFYHSSGTFFPLMTQTTKSTLTNMQDNARVKMAIGWSLGFFPTTLEVTAAVVASQI